MESNEEAKQASQSEELELITLGAGCFWCVEAVLEQVEGIESVRSGYMGGQVESPTYKEVCTGSTGHAEVVQVAFRPAVIDCSSVLAWFWRLHDPTTLNRQGADVGTQYRSAIFYHSDEQKAKAEAQIKEVNASKVFKAPIVTEVSAAVHFYPAEDYHQDYYEKNKDNPDGNIGYCRYMIAPKLDMLGLKK